MLVSLLGKLWNVLSKQWGVLAGVFGVGLVYLRLRRGDRAIDENNRLDEALRRAEKLNETKINTTRDAALERLSKHNSVRRD